MPDFVLKWQRRPNSDGWRAFVWYGDVNVGFLTLTQAQAEEFRLFTAFAEEGWDE